MYLCTQTIFLLHSQQKKHLLQNPIYIKQSIEYLIFVKKLHYKTYFIGKQECYYMLIYTHQVKKYLLNSEN